MMSLTSWHVVARSCPRAADGLEAAIHAEAHGSIVGAGPHESLLATCPLYGRLVRYQLGEPIAGARPGRVA